MQGVKTGLLMFLLSPLALAVPHGEITESGGNMRFQGVIVAETCRVEAGDRQMMIHMGPINSNRFHPPFGDTDLVLFDVQLEDCTKMVRQHLGLSFSGVLDDKNPDVLSVGEGPGVATGVGVALFDTNNKLIPLNGSPSEWQQLYTGPSTLHFIAKYRATDNHVTQGATNAQAWFALTYE